MFNKIFGKDETAPTTEALAAAAEEAARAERQLWEAKLQAALGDDEALLALAVAAPAVELKCAAVNAIAGEDVLKRAEREFREHDRRVHRDAKKRYEGMIAQREARQRAGELIVLAGELLKEASVPANRLVELDNQWQALGKPYLEAGQIAQYNERWQQLTAITRERGDQQQRTKRWLAEAAQASSRLIALCQEVVQGHKERAALQPAIEQVDAMLGSAPAEGADSKSNRIGEMRSALQDAHGLANALQARQQWLEALHPTDSARAEPNDLVAEWQNLPMVGHAAIARTLDAAFASWQHSDTAARASIAQQKIQQKREESKADHRVKAENLEKQVAEAEAALAGGHIAEVAPLLNSIDAAIKSFSPDRKVVARIEALQAEYARLKGWQHWGGGRVREDVVAEAEALAKASTEPKLALKAHADSIEKLRERWKELDKLGGATNKQLWQRFDAALKTAYTPVAEQLAKLKAARNENLDARRKLIAALDAIALAAEPVAAAPDAAASPGTDSAAPAAAPTDWRAIARSLDHFQTEWRKLGPVQHTVPRKAQDSLAKQLAASVSRLETPLNELRLVERLKREKLIERAAALSSDARGKDTINKVRELQAEWQQHAKGLPLPRNIENALWLQFKAATDAVFAARDAAHAARENEFKGHETARLGLIDRLAALTADTAAAEIKRTIADVDTQWRKCGEAPRNVAAKLEARFRAARDAAQQLLAGSAQRAWGATCDTLTAKLALCTAAEAAPGAEHQEAWAALPALPVDWETALAKRFAAAQAGKAIAANENTLREQLLQLESALEIPSPAGLAEDRRMLKLRAMKLALEGKQPAGITSTAQMIVSVLSAAQPGADAAARIDKVVSALRNKPPR